MKKKYGYWRLSFFLILLFPVLLYVLLYVESNDPDGSIQNWFDTLWYTIVTMTTVGYGDYYPVTPIGKLVGVILLLTSVILFGFFVGNLTNSIRNYMEKKKLGYFGVDFKEHIVVIGWDRFAQRVIQQIVSAGKRVVVVTNQKNEVDLINDLFPSPNVFAFFADYDNSEALRKINIEESSVVYLNFPDDTETLVYLLNLKKHYENLIYIVSLEKPNLKGTFTAAGVTYAISKNEISSKLVASYIFEPDVAKLTEDLMATAVNEDDFDLLEFQVTPENPFLNMDYLAAFMKMKTDYDCILLGLSKLKEGQRILLKNPTQGATIEEKDYLLLLSNGTSKRKIEKIFGVREGRPIGK